jgi:hypothetical protein
MAAFHPRITQASGSPYAVGFALGQQIGVRLEENITRYLQQGPVGQRGLELLRLREGALGWMQSLPVRFQQEMEGLAAGAGIALQRVAEWCYAEECPPGCSAFLIKMNGQVWVGRNNDLWAPDLWGYATLRAVEGRIATINLGMEAEPFTSTGMNQQQVWLHYNYLPVDDRPSGDRRTLPPYVLITEMLESCTSLQDVENALEQTERTGGMLLFAVDGKRQQYAIYECTCQRYNKRLAECGWLAGTNHSCTSKDGRGARSSYTRYDRMVAAIGEMLQDADSIHLPGDLVHILADDGVEQRGEDSGTVFAAVACPGESQLWYTFGGFPAASQGHWQPVPLPWA